MEKERDSGVRCDAVRCGAVCMYVYMYVVGFLNGGDAGFCCCIFKNRRKG